MTTALGTRPVPDRRRKAFTRLLRTEALLFARTPMAVTWAALLPVVAFVVLGFVPAVARASDDLDGNSYLGVYLPILMAFSLVMSAVSMLPSTLAAYRENGILRRLSTTPVPPSWLLAAQAGIYATVSLLVSVLLFVVGIAFDVAVPRQPAGFALSLLLLTAALIGLGVLVAAVVRTGKAASALGSALFFPLMFLAGLWVPRPLMPETLRTISDFSPLGAGVGALQDSVAGQWPSGWSLLVLAGWAVLTGALAVRFFRWE